MAFDRDSSLLNPPKLARGVIAATRGFFDDVFGMDILRASPPAGQIPATTATTRGRRFIANIDQSAGGYSLTVRAIRSNTQIDATLPKA